MKKIFLFVICALMSVCTFAQSKINWEGQAGLNISKYNTVLYGSNMGFHVGVRGQMDVPSLFNGAYINAGALFSLKGASIDMGELADGKSSAYYLDIPVHLGYKHTVNDNFSVFGEFGPYFAFGLFGKTDSNTIDYDDDYEQVSSYESHNTFDEFKRFDFGLGIRLGVEFRQKYTFSIGYDFGLANTWNKNWEKEESEYDDEINLVEDVKNRNLTISIGYKF
ncbi:MAG: porin family protein [Prevotella pectinovora]|uniref:porin family protein n=1 Tax=Prevotella pectinovora TaxID=1602169 RepID=UPI002E776F25|nr:porin family protein [Prevotella pectinovora]MEE1546236.1 porin family protein [Prevotella pectinovora]